MESKKERFNLILHTCCGVCAAGIVGLLKDRFAITLFFYNPNIQPKEEYERRKQAARCLAKELQVGFLEGDYDVENWLEAIEGLEHELEGGERCLVCFRHRIKRAAFLAREWQKQLSPCGLLLGISTTLLASHLKDSDILQKIGAEAEKEFNIKFMSFADLAINKAEVARLGKEIVSNLGLYRQKYCGCRFSDYSE